MLAATAAGLIGCASDPEEESPTSGAAAPLVTEGDQVRALDVSVAVRSEGLFSRWGDGESAEAAWRMRRGPTPTGTGGGEWAVERLREPGGDVTEQQTLRLLEDGTVALSRQVEHSEQVLIEFDPPMIVMPAALSVGDAAAVEQTFRMVVRPIKDPDRVKAQGSATNRVTYLGLDSVNTPEGAVTARRVRSVLKADLPPSQITNITDQWFVDGVGLVAERRRERTLVMGLPIRDNREAWVRTDRARPDPRTEPAR